MPPALRARISEPGEVLEPVPELFPFTGPSGDDPTEPGDWPFDRQCILRLPDDIAERVEACLCQHENGDNVNLDFRFRPSLTRRSGNPSGRHWEVKVFGETLNGTLVDLPCRVESHLLPKPQPPMTDDCPGRIAFKSADIEQMLIVHREPEPPDVTENLDRRTFQWGSGLTPPTRQIRRRKFRGKPPPDSEFNADRISDAVRAIQKRMNNEPYVYEECTEVDESFYEEVLRTKPDLVWRPPVRKKMVPVSKTVGNHVSTGKQETRSAPNAEGRPQKRLKLFGSKAATSTGSGPGSGISKERKLRLR